MNLRGSGWYALMVLAAILFLAATAQAAQWEDGTQVREQFVESTFAVFKKQNFSQLESTASELRKTKERFPEGHWKLSLFYNGLDPQYHAGKFGGWQKWFAALEEWKKQFPESITQRVAHASALTSFAWKARGSGYANTVSPEGWKQFGERLQQARDILEQAKSLPEKCPEWYAVMQTVALGQSWDRAEYEQLFSEAVAFEPNYQDFYFSKATYLMPRWCGRPGEWERFAKEAMSIAGIEAGTGIYARIAWAQSGYHENLFKETAIEWPMMKQGLLDLERTFPSNWNSSALFRFATLAGDRETAKAVYERLGGRINPRMWTAPGQVNKARLWVTGQEIAKPRATLQARAGEAKSLAFSPDGKVLAAGYSDGSLVLWDVERAQAAGKFESQHDEIGWVDFSPDGKLIAAAVGAEEAKTGGLVKIWETSSRRKRATIDGWKATVLVVKFSPDGKFLVATGGQWGGKFGEARTWDTATGVVTPLEWPLKHKHELQAAAISLDNRYLVTDCNRSITVWDLVENKSAFDTKQTLKKYVRCLAFSPDGKTLAAALGGGWAARNEPSWITFWDVPGFTERSSGIENPIGGLNRIAFSPDGKLIAGGGYEQCVRVWDTESLKEVATFFGHTNTIGSLAFSPDGKTLASASSDGTVKLWNPPESK